MRDRENGVNQMRGGWNPYDVDFPHATPQEIVCSELTYIKKRSVLAAKTRIEFNIRFR